MIAAISWPELTSVDIAMAAAIVVLTVISIATAIAETTLMRVSKAKASALADEGRPGGRALVELVEQPERWLNALLLVVLGCQIIQASLLGVLFGDLFGPWGVIIGAFVVLLASYSLVQDFDQIQQGVRNGAPRQFGWLGGFGIMVTVVWLYIEILRIIAILRGNN